MLNEHWNKRCILKSTKCSEALLQWSSFQANEWQMITPKTMPASLVVWTQPFLKDGYWWHSRAPCAQAHFLLILSASRWLCGQWFPKIDPHGALAWLSTHAHTQSHRRGRSTQMNRRDNYFQRWQKWVNGAGILILIPWVESIGGNQVTYISTMLPITAHQPEVIDQCTPPIEALCYHTKKWQ